MRILALDPGLENPALAYHEDLTLHWATRVKLPAAWIQLDVLDRADKISDACMRAIALLGIVGIDTLVVEFPQWYSRSKSLGDPNDLAGLAAVAGTVAGRLSDRAHDPIKILSPRPRDVWGNLPKSTKGDPWASPRGLRLASRLAPDERAAVQDKHDALDAAGLALWAAGRWQRRRLMPGAVE